MTVTARSEKVLMSNPRHFTLRQVNARVPLMRAIARDINRVCGEIVEERRILQYKESHPTANEEDSKNKLNYLIDKINGYIREVEELGGMVERFTMPAFSFSALTNSAQVNKKTCQIIWVYDEPRATLWKWPHNSLDEAGELKYRN